MFITDLSKSNFNIQIYIRYIDMYVNTFACIKRITASLISRCSTSIYIYMYYLYMNYVNKSVRLLFVQPK